MAGLGTFGGIAQNPWLQQLSGQALQTGLNRLLNPMLGQGQSAQTPSLFGVSPGTAAGVGLGLASGALGKEPGEVVEARQFLRNRFTSPTALTDQFTGQLGALTSQYQPLLAQQRQRGLADVSQRYAAAFPSTVGAQGPEFGALSRYITDEALPREQAVLGDTAKWLVDTQGNAAGKILDTSKPDPFAAALGQLGGMLILRDAFGNPIGQGTAGSPNVLPATGSPGAGAPWPPSTGMPGAMGPPSTGGQVGSNQWYSPIGQMTGAELLDQLAIDRFGQQAGHHRRRQFQRIA